MGLLSSSPHNQLLAALPRQELDRISSRLRPVRLSRGQLLWERDGPISHVFFLESGVVAAMAHTSNNTGVEAAVLGSEGIIGIGALMGGTAPMMHSVQVPAIGHTLNAEEFRQEWARGGAMQKAVMFHTRFLLSEMAQSTLCARLHSLEARLCRWLVVVSERMGSDELPLTQEYLASLLGARRAGVTITAGVLREQGLIDYRRGRIFVTDREALKANACECAGVVSEQLRNLHSDYEMLKA